MTASLIDTPSHPGPAVIVPKPNGDIRLCVNYQELKKVTIPDHFPLLHLDSLIEKASMSSFISTLDLSKVFLSTLIQFKKIHS